MVIVCVISLTGHGGVPFWRILALILTAGTLAVCAAIQIRRKNESRKQQERKAVPNREDQGQNPPEGNSSMALSLINISMCIRDRACLL